ncbi:hypothetical protein H5410_057471 [Solanum commersonii]|uniref:Uncharacterized protein n=1 Tax=Solanum commersonii TaxID=4109 RepID=A0A9J5WN58_SOLCO|nr:hypothetical protein H5410_057471 [Solanum commersonii]
MVMLPYEPSFDEKTIPTRARPIQMNHELMIHCEKEIHDLLQKQIISPRKSPWTNVHPSGGSKPRFDNFSHSVAAISTTRAPIEVENPMNILFNSSKNTSTSTLCQYQTNKFPLPHPSLFLQAEDPPLMT